MIFYFIIYRHAAAHLFSALGRAVDLCMLHTHTRENTHIHTADSSVLWVKVKGRLPNSSWRVTRCPTVSGIVCVCVSPIINYTLTNIVTNHQSYHVLCITSQHFYMWVRATGSDAARLNLITWRACCSLLNSSTRLTSYFGNEKCCIQGVHVCKVALSGCAKCWHNYPPSWENHMWYSC